MTDRVPNKEAIRVWVDALRSGKYTQGKGRLKSESGERYCCLGVAAELFPVGGEWCGNRFDYLVEYDDGIFPASESMILPPPVAEFLGLAKEPMVFVPEEFDFDEDEEFELTELNDGVGMSFEDIATCIEYTYLKENENV